MKRRLADIGLLRPLLHNASLGLMQRLAALTGKKPQTVVLSLRGSYPYRTQPRKLLSFPPDLGPRDPSLEALETSVEALCRAAWLETVIVRVEDLEVSLTTALALRNLLARLRTAGKRLVFYAPSLDMASYLIASRADEVVVPESAEFGIFGMSLNFLFMRDALARLGLKFDKLAIREYKNAGDQFVRQDMSEAQREQYGALLESLETSWLETVARGRDTFADTVRAWIDEGVVSAERALESNIVDRIAYEDELIPEDAALHPAVKRLLPGSRRPYRLGRIAVIKLEGLIVAGKSRRLPFPLPLLGDTQAGAETLTRSLRAAAQDESVKAVVFLVDSGGGSALASDLIWRELTRLKTKKPVVAVMGRVAASGGYYVLTHADRVVASPLSVTGSIGVVMAKAVLAGFYEQYGFHQASLQRGRFARTYSSAESFDEAERELVERSLEHIYRLFVRRVAEGRGLSEERVDEIGRGRIWSGRTALELGLVDALGGVPEAVEAARQLAELPKGTPVINLEPPKSTVMPHSGEATALLGHLRVLAKEHSLLWTEVPFEIV